jgi:hypothetical protein
LAVKPSSRVGHFFLRTSYGRLLLVVLALAAVAAVGWWQWGDPRMARVLTGSAWSGKCQRNLTRAVLDRSLDLGTDFMLAHQKPEGNFDYEYDWRKRTQSRGDNQVRQVGALWGLTLIYQDRPSKALEQAIETSLGFFAEHSKLSPSGGRCIVYPGDDKGATGTVALMALSLIDYLRALEAHQPDARREGYQKTLGEYLKQLVGAVNEQGLWFGSYKNEDCSPVDVHSPYSDGEALLALVKAAKYLGHRELEPTIRRTAGAGHLRNVERALKKEPDSDTTKGYYQWSSMAFFELATSGWPDTEHFGDYVLELAHWMVDVHQTLTRTRNTAYAYEGLIHAYELARRRNDTAAVHKLGCVIDIGLEHLISWQVGGPLATARTSGPGSQDRLARGGIQNSANEPGLRIDVTQHQMHATILARRYVYKN